MSDVFRFTIDGAPWLVRTVRGIEALGEPFRFEILGHPEEPSEDAAFAKGLVTAPAELAWSLDAGGERTLQAVVDAVEATPEGFRVEICAKIGVLADTLDHKVFLDEDAIAIATSVLSEHGVTLTSKCTRTPEKRAQCVQAFESDLAFVTRILAEEGIVWTCDPESPDAVLAIDAPSGFPELGGDPLAIRHDAGFSTRPSVFRARLRKRIATDKVALRDYDFKAPDLDLSAEAKEGDGVLERYEYRGHYKDPGLGQKLAKIRLEAHRTGSVELTGETTSRAFAAGRVVKLESGAGGMEGEWILTRVEHRGADRNAGADDRPYSARFHAVPREAGYRPERRASAKLGGVQTLDVVGPSGKEIHTEQHGQIKAHFRWDRLRPKDDTASAWLRVVQPPTSGGFFLPRVGWETLVGFWGTSGDTPFELGRLYNGVSPPPAGLPGKKVVSQFGTQTTPGGGSANVIQMDDTAGNEGMSFNASRDFNERTENDKVTGVTADDSHTVGANRKVIVGQVHAVEVTGAQSYSVAAKRTMNVTANKTIKTGSETVAIGGARIFDVGGDQSTESATLARVVGGAKMEACIEQQSIAVTGASVVVVGGSWGQLAGLSAGLSVGGASKEEVGGAKNITALKYGLTVKGSLKETYASRSIDAGSDINDVFATSATYDVSGAMNLTGSNVIVHATSKITIKAGGMTITITPSAVKISGKFDSGQAAKDKNTEDYD